MSTYYFVYVEAKVNNKWYLISGRSPRIQDDGTVDFKPNETYYNGSRSYFSNTFDKLRDIGTYGTFADASDDIKEIYKYAVESENDGRTVYEDIIFVKYGDFIKWADTEEHDSHGVIHKDHIFAFENGDLEELYGEEHDDLKDLTEEERSQYSYYEWDDPFGWLAHFKDILSLVRPEITKFGEVNICPDVQEYRIVVVRE